MLDTLQDVRLIADTQDRVVWRFNKEGVYSTNSFVQVLQEQTLTDDILSYKFTNEIWKGMVPPRIELFTWFVLVGRVNTKDRLSRLGIIERSDNVCVMCSKEIESVQHLFVTCEYAWQVWCAWIRHMGHVWSIPGSIKEHFESWRTMTLRKDVRKIWLVGFFQNKTADVVDCVNRSFCCSREWCKN
ncbi:hypothetical protein AHAS_Ahas17G0130700 [Arachis hypogaea]